MSAPRVSIVVATFGDERWREMAAQRAIPSARRQLGCEVVEVHGDTLHGARNDGLAQVRTEWVVFLDADDELERGYVDILSTGLADVRVPAVRYVRSSGLTPRARMPRVAGHQHDCTAECLRYGNWIVIGAMARTEHVIRCGGFDDHPWSEDWCLWGRMMLAGCTFEAIPQATYRAHVRLDSRNRGAAAATKLQAHRDIAAELGFPIP